MRGLSQAEPDGYGYSRWSAHYRGLGQDRLSQSHPTGERMFVAMPQAIEVYGARTGEIRAAQIFVALMGASSYTPLPRRAGHRRCPTGSARMSAPSPLWTAGSVAARRGSSRRTGCSGSLPDAGPIFQPKQP